MGQSGGSDKLNAKLVIKLLPDGWSPENAGNFPPIRTIELTFAGYGIFKVLISGARQIIQTGHQDNRPTSVEKILASCDLAEQYGEVERAILDFLTEHFGPTVVSPSVRPSMQVE